MEEEIDLLDLFWSFWKKKLWLILALVIGGCIGIVYTRFIITPKYTSSVTLILSKPTTGITSTTLDANSAITQSDIILNQKLISTYGEIMKSKSVATTVIDNLGLDMEYLELKKGINVASVKDTDIMTFSITTTDAKLSADIATEMTKVFSEEVVKIYKIQNISVIDPAEVIEKPVNVNYIKNIIIFAVIAFMLVGIIIFLIYYFDTTIKGEEDVQKLTGLPILATIPRFKDEKEGKKNE